LHLDNLHLDMAPASQDAGVFLCAGSAAPKRASRGFSSTTVIERCKDLQADMRDSASCSLDNDPVSRG
jgi:hypothetical protein